VKVRLIQSRDDGSLLEIDQVGALIKEPHYFPIVPDRDELPIPNRRRLCHEAAIVQCRDFSVE